MIRFIIDKIKRYTEREFIVFLICTVVLVLSINKSYENTTVIVTYYGLASVFIGGRVYLKSKQPTL